MAINKSNAKQQKSENNKRKAENFITATLKANRRQQATANGRNCNTIMTRKYVAGCILKEKFKLSKDLGSWEVGEVFCSLLGGVEVDCVR